MNKEEFMTRLKELLADLPDDENKQDALNYYQDYLEEAGENTAAKNLEARNGSHP